MDGVRQWCQLNLTDLCTLLDSLSRQCRRLLFRHQPEADSFAQRGAINKNNHFFPRGNVKCPVTQRITFSLNQSTCVDNENWVLSCVLGHKKN